MNLHVNKDYKVIAENDNYMVYKPLSLRAFDCFSKGLHTFNMFDYQQNYFFYTVKKDNIFLNKSKWFYVIVVKEDGIQCYDLFNNLISFDKVLQDTGFDRDIINPKKQIEKFLTQCGLDIQKAIIHEDLMVSYKDSINLSHKNFKVLPIQFKEVEGDFILSNCELLETLEGSPQIVHGDYRCDYCVSIKTFKGCPKEVKGDFYCTRCYIQDLRCTPNKIEGNCTISKCALLETLEGLPNTINGNLDISFNKSLVNLKGSPEYIKGDLICNNCESLKTLEDNLKQVEGDLICYFSENLNSLGNVVIKGNIIRYGNSKLNIKYNENEEKNKIYNLVSFYKLNPELAEVQDDLSVNYKGSVDLSFRKFEKLPFKFGVVMGGFSVKGCENLKTLENAPTKVYGSFDCSSCHSLISLEHSPKKVKGSFYTRTNHLITSLKGSPEKVGNHFDCNNCVSLTNLKGSPKIVGGNYLCNKCLNLRSFKGSPEHVGGHLLCSNTSIKDFTNSPKEIQGNIVCIDCEALTSLKGITNKLYGELIITKCPNLRDFKCRYFKNSKQVNGILRDCLQMGLYLNGIKVLDDLSVDYKYSIHIRKDNFDKLPVKFNIVEGDLSLAYCDFMVDLVNLPKIVKGNFSLYSNNLMESFTGGPEYVGGAVHCLDCPSLVDITNLPKEIGGDFTFKYNAKKLDVEDIKLQCKVKGNIFI